MNPCQRLDGFHFDNNEVFDDDVGTEISIELMSAIRERDVTRRIDFEARSFQFNNKARLVD